MDDVTLIQDLYEITKAIASKFTDYRFIIVGHSMGGAIAAKFVQKYESDEELRIKALIVLDVVEGSAIDALPNMNTIIESRPKSFKSIKEALSWSLTSRTLLNKHSAKISVPMMITQQNDEFVWKCDLKKTSK